MTVIGGMSGEKNAPNLPNSKTKSKCSCSFSTTFLTMRSFDLFVKFGTVASSFSQQNLATDSFLLKKHCKVTRISLWSQKRPGR